MARKKHHKRRGSKKDTRRYGQRYSFSAINKAMGMNPRRGKKHRSKRRNPNQFPAPFASGLNPRRRGRKRRNPGGLERTLRDGTSLSLHRDGDQGVLYIHHANGTMDDFRGAWKRALSKFKAFKSGKSYGRHAQASAWHELAMDNPRRRKGRGRKHRNPSDDPRYATTRIIRKPTKSRRNCGMSRRNPAQFPMPFSSAMNPRISRKEARGMGQVLRRHGYKKCRI